jgi:hypothetical protein
VSLLKKPDHNPLDKTKRELQTVKSVVSVGQSFKNKNPEKAVQQMLMAGIKMAGSPFSDPLIKPLALVRELKKIGIGALTWEPETLMNVIDTRYHGWTPERVVKASEHFHKTGTLDTDVPKLVREKIFALRVVGTSNSAQNEWDIFEKVGGAFNDRVAQFGVTEPLSPSECAATVAVIESVRPEEYANEVKIYIAASCHEEGLCTVTPVKWISMAEPHLQEMNESAMGEPVDPALKNSIKLAYNNLIQRAETLREVPDTVELVQATKLIAIEYAAREILNG